MSVATEITRIQNAKAGLKTSIEAKGVTVASDALIDDYAGYVDNIPTGGGGTKIAVSPDVSEYTGGSEFTLGKVITSVNFPSGITSLGNYAFYYCSSLTSITIPSTVTSIGNYAFQQCTGLTSIVIPDSVTSISTRAFSGCSHLTSFTCEATTPPTLGSNALNSTNNCPIYVPAESVETYKSASVWSDYASRIQAIPTTVE